MDRAPELLAALSTTKRCTDCGLRIEHGGFPSCERTAYVRPADGTVAYRACSLERSLDAIGCGERAIHFIPTEQALAARSVRRLQLVQAIGKAIEHLTPDAQDAQEILGALEGAVKRRFGDDAGDVEEGFKHVSTALEELEEPEIAPVAKRS